MTAAGSRFATAARDWLVEPAPPAVEPYRRRPVVAVLGLAPRCGTTVVARALAAALAAADSAGAAAVWSAEPAAALGMATRQAGRLAAALADVPRASARGAGRLCLVAGPEPLALANTAAHHAPLVLDGGASGLGGSLAAVADRVVLVAVPRLEPALGAVVASRLAPGGPVPLLVLNRAEGGPGRWTSADHVLPESRLAARLAVGGRETRGAFARVVRAMADGLT